MRRKNKTAKFVILSCLAILLFQGFGCGESFYDNMELTSMSDHLEDVPSAVDMNWALDQHHIESVALVGSLPSRLNPEAEDSLEGIADQNKVLLEVRARKPERIFAFPLISPEDENPASTIARYVMEEKAFGPAIDPATGQDLFSEKMLRFYEACELSGARIVFQVPDISRVADLERIASDYPNNIILAPQLAGLYSDLDRLKSLLWRFNNIYLGFGFGPEDRLLQAAEDITKDIDKLHSLFAEHRERICFATETALTKEPYRNASFAETQIRFMRRLLEKNKAELVIKTRNNKWIRKEFPGLGLGKQVLGYFYKLNFFRAMTGSPPRMDKNNLNLLVGNLPAGATFDFKSEKRVIGAMVVNKGRLVTGVSSPDLKRILSGKITNFSEISGDDMPVELVSYGPVAAYLAKKHKVTLADDVKVISDPDAFTRYVAKTPGALGFATFAQLDQTVRCLTVDGEAPTISYVKYCAAKGAGTYGHYFDTYPLLIPMEVPTQAAAMAFNPHELRRIVFAGPTTFGPFSSGNDDRVFAQRPTNDASPYMRDAGITLVNVKGMFRENCTGDDCSDIAFLPALLATGADTILEPISDQENFNDVNALHLLSPDSPMTRIVRNQAMTIVGGKSGTGDLAVLVALVKSAKEKGRIVTAALDCPEDQFAHMANELSAAGASAVVNVGQRKINPWVFEKDGLLIQGIGAPFLPKSQTGEGALCVLTFYKDKFIAAEAVMVESKEGVTRELTGERADTALSLAVTQAP